jgi:hypothetical protein
VRQCSSRELERANGPALAPVEEAKEFHPMLDAVLLIMGIGFFVASIGYAVACDRL